MRYFNIATIATSLREKTVNCENKFSITSKE